MNISEKLISFCWNLNYDHISPEIIIKAKECILDHFGVVMGGIQTDVGIKVVNYAKMLGPEGPATILGHSKGASVYAAAFANGTLSEVLELQDGWRFGNIHPCVVIPSSLAIGEQRGATGKDLLVAVVAGYELSNRIAYAMHPNHLAQGYLPAGTAGTCGAAMAAAKMMNLNLEQTQEAVNIAGFILPVSTAENLWGGYSIKPVHSGQASKVGIEAAQLAIQGFRACPLEGSPERGNGWCEIMSGPTKIDRLVNLLGSWYTISDVYFKWYPLCRHAHSACEAALNLSKRIPSRLKIVKVIVRTYSLAAGLLNRYPHGSLNQVAYQFSIPYVVAYALLRKNLNYLSYIVKNLIVEDIKELADKVEIIADDDLTASYPDITPSVVEIYADSFFDSERCDTPKGDPRVPVEENELETKYIELASPLLGIERASAMKELVNNLENIDNVRVITDIFRKIL
jgi:2-methylcitrate dehydratase PrpD